MDGSVHNEKDADYNKMLGSINYSTKLYKYLMVFKPLKIKRKLSLKLFTINGPVMSTCLTQRLN